MSSLNRLEMYGKISEARLCLAKKRDEVLEKRNIEKYDNATVEATIKHNTDALNKWNCLLKFLLEKKEQLECLVAESGSTTNFHIKLELLHQIIDVFVLLTTFTTKLEFTCNNAVSSELSGAEFILNELYESASQGLRDHYKNSATIMKFYKD